MLSEHFYPALGILFCGRDVFSYGVRFQPLRIGDHWALDRGHHLLYQAGSSVYEGRNGSQEGREKAASLDAIKKVHSACIA